MRLRLRIELQDDQQNPIGTVTWTPSGGTFTAPQADSVFSRLLDILNSPELKRRVNMLNTLADAEISVTSPPNISIST